VAEWRRIEAMIDELEDIRAMDAALARPDRRMIPFEVTSAILDGASPIRAWREHRGMGQGALAKAAGIEPARLMKLEAGTRKAAPDELRRLARTLRVQVDDLSDPPAR
jgi:ribosome-binding protein aMBF1 (putative translation factor)